MRAMSELVLYVGDHDLSSWSLRPFLALDASGLPYRLEVIELDRPGTKAKIDAVSPNGKVPVLHRTGDTPLVIPESLAICELCAELAPAAKLWPDDRDARAVARAVSTEMHAGFAALRREHPMHITSRIERPPSDEVRRDLGRIEAIFADARARFGAGGPFLFGRFSIADCMFAPVATRVRTYGLPAGPATRAFMEAIFAHPSFVKWETAARLTPRAR
jgi:glutathione S-transferase